MTSPFIVAPVVEGQGDVAALPVLLRRIAASIDPSRPVEILQPVRSHRSKMTNTSEAERYLALAMAKLGTADGAVLVLLDADDDCAATLGPELLGVCAAIRPDVAVSVVLAVAEFEAWFLAAAPSLRDRRGLPHDLEAPEDPESIRDAKGWLRQHRTDGLGYSPTTDQPALAALFDLDAARAGAPSFDKLWRDVERLMAETST